MAQLQMQNFGGAAPLRYKENFQKFHGGAGSRSALLASALGVAMDAAPKIGVIESEKAFKEGMEARIDGASREDAKSGGLLGFMFSDRVKDGFDYQDAQLALPALINDEILDMEAALHNSRRPEDFAAWAANRDKVVQEQLKDRSDVYRYAVAEQLTKTRMKQAEMHMQIVMSNRSKDRTAAAKAAAQAKLDEKNARLDAAASAAYALGDDGSFTDVEMGEFVKSAPKLFGITEKAAKDIYIESATDRALMNNNEVILTGIDPRYLTRDQRELILKTEETARSQRVTQENQQYTRATRDAEAADKANKAELTASLRELRLNGSQPQDLRAAAMDSPYGQENPDKALAIAETYAGTYDSMVDVAAETLILQDMEDEAATAALTGDWTDFNSMLDQALTENLVRSSKVESMLTMQRNAEAASDEVVTTMMETVAAEIENEFILERPRQGGGDPTPLQGLSETTETFTLAEQNRVKELATKYFMVDLKKYLDANPDVTVRTIDDAALDRMAEKAKRGASAQFRKEKAYVAPTAEMTIEGRSTDVPTTQESMAALNAILKK